MAKKDDKKNNPAINGIKKRLLDLNKNIYDLLKDMSNNNSGYDIERASEIQKLQSKANRFADNEINDIKNKTADDISKFFFDLSRDNLRQFDNESQQITDLFNMNREAVYQMIDASARNRNIYYDRLSIISEHLHELEEAVSTMRDSIVTADDFSNRISRSVTFVGVEDEKNEEYIIEYEAMEKELKLQHEIKSFIVPKTLTLGIFFAIDIPYSHIFARTSIAKTLQYIKFQQAKRKSKKEKSDINKATITAESFGFDNTNVESIYIAESTNIKDYVDFYNERNVFGNKIEMEAFNDVSIDIIIEDSVDPILYENFSNADVSSLTEDSIYKKIQKSIGSKRMNGVKSAQERPKFQDGNFNEVVEEFGEFSGCYSRLMDPRKLIPIYGLSRDIIGYILIHDKKVLEGCAPIAANGRTRFSAMTNDADRNNIIAQLAENIYKVFDKQFLVDHSKFTDVIAQALLYKDYYTNGATFQFIPVDYVTKFSIDEDMDGFGTSMLKKSLFKAQLYLGMYIFKYMSAIDRSNDTRIHYVKSGSLDQKTENQVQKVMRQIVERTPSFSRFSSYSGMMDTINVVNRDIIVPTGKDDIKGIEFDVLSGQDVQMNNDFLEDTRSSYINASGVASVIMNYVNEADYAKTLVMASTKTAARATNYQLDLNPAITERHKKLMRCYCPNIPKDVIDKFEFKFVAPKSLILGNTSDLIGSASQSMEFISKCLIGENSDTTELDNILKDKMNLSLAKMLLPMFPWARFEDMLSECKVNGVESGMEKQNNDSE